MARVKSLMKQWDDDSRGIIYVEWKGRTSAHVFNAEYRNGKVQYIDAKTGKVIKGHQYFGDAKLSSIKIYRTDDKGITTQMKEMVRKRGR